MADVNIEPSQSKTSGPARPDTVVPIEKLKPNPKQPRRHFVQEDLEDLSNSIREKGVLQPLIVRPLPDGNFEIVAGERRWRAAQLARLHELPVLSRDLDDVEVLEIAIIENIQRADLNAIEEAAGYRQLMDSFGHTQEKLATALGKSRSHIANLMRLLSLPEDVLELVKEGKLSAGHARALITSEDPSAMARAVVKGRLSVRETEVLVKKSVEGSAQANSRSKKRPGGGKDADTKALEADLSANLGMMVDLSHKPGQEGGALTIKYKSLEDLDTLCRLLSGS